MLYYLEKYIFYLFLRLDTYASTHLCFFIFQTYVFFA